MIQNENLQGTYPPKMHFYKVHSLSWNHLEYPFGCTVLKTLFRASWKKKSTPFANANAESWYIYLLYSKKEQNFDN